MSPSSPKPTRGAHLNRRGDETHHLRYAIALIIFVVAGTYFAVTKQSPLADEYEITAVFDNAVNIRARSPVRIAGVNVGQVKGIEAAGDEAAKVTFTVSDEGRPIHEDASAQIRPRIFLEGNFFIDLRPGSPSAPELDEHGTIPVTRTATAVQIDQVLTALQKPTREALRELIQGYGGALNRKPTAAEDAGQDPDVRGESAAEATNDAFVYGGPAARDSAIVSEALLGTEPHDLSRLIAAQADVFTALAAREGQLQDLLTNFNTTIGAFAAESENLAETTRLLGPTLERAEPALRHTDAMLPPLRDFAAALEPSLRELPATIAASGPWLRQARLLMGDRELGGLASQLRLAGKPAAKATGAGRGFFSQVERTSRCFDQVILPTGDVVLDDSGVGFDFSSGVENYKEFLYALTGVAGATQGFDGNGPFLRVQAGNGPLIVRTPQVGGGPKNDFLYGRTLAAPIGTRPVAGTGDAPPFRTDIACHNNAIPDLNGSRSDVGPASPDVFP